ncbi:hypothetical protein CH63R_05840 [Colletotrichum higginsianum IMI 349063]|uniref:Uncharacterized protein n=1 Tax=Colletotrichum higginsianum (strain IMI 349063) TaxID=759273 RepID=A0A1B7YEA2_COLHI|nr:hypothetical protein CH63R_05840 [Colletotrichum higginsianum IMI 349063]OBR10148.1 hypothetical protein CH63R_05840 [Colletotrichum higginsianum IMI 349063]
MTGLGVLGKSNQSPEAESQVAGRRNAGMAPLGTSEGRRGFLGTTRIGTGAVLGPYWGPYYLHRRGASGAQWVDLARTAGSEGAVTFLALPPSMNLRPHPPKTLILHLLIMALHGRE